MAKIGVVAGEGRMPLEFARSARARGEKVVVFALTGAASEELESVSERVYWLEVGQYAKFALILLKEQLKNIVLLGKVPKQLVYQDQGYEEKARSFLRNVGDNMDYSLLAGITKHFAKFGVQVIDPRPYLGHLIVRKGSLTKVPADESLKADISFGCEIARKLSGLDVGQTVVVKRRAVVSVEAMEGTDAVIERSHKIAGEGCVMVKLSRPSQDMRWDIPVIGERTVQGLLEGAFSALVLESEKMFFLDKDPLTKTAENKGLYIEAV